MSKTQPNLLSDDSLRQAKAVKNLLKENYLADNRPWVVAYSGGKDSTLLLQLTYEMLFELGISAQKPVYVLSNDTLVETPRVESHLRSTLAAIEETVVREKLPIICKLVTPGADETYWAKLIGKGYPPPTRTFRWCTKSMKIKPARRFVESITAKYGSVVLLLGTRLSESSARRHRMEGRAVNARGLNPHHEIPNSYVLTPIAEWEIEDVWEYLLYGPIQSICGDNENLAGLYRDATGGECPLILDMTTPSCGGSRFGCWTCTVVKQDRSLQGFIDSGDHSMIPLIEYCQWLRSIRENDERRLKHRRDGSAGLGPFDGRTRKELLRRLLETEQVLGRELISCKEIEYIQDVWSREIDLADSAFEIFESFGRTLSKERAVMAFDNDQLDLIRNISNEEGIPVNLLEQIIKLADDFPDLTVWGAKAQVKSKIRDIINAASGECA